jgi:hypothetical protein
VRPGLWAALAVVVVALGCGPGEPVKRPVVPREDPEKHLLRIGKIWQERSLDEGFLENDPQGMAFFRIETLTKVTFSPGGKAEETIARTEYFKTKSGAEFHCEAKGVVPAVVTFSRTPEEIRVSIENGEASLPRTCREPGFPVGGKQIPRGRTVFALREERLVAVDPPRSRAVLLPMQ